MTTTGASQTRWPWRSSVGLMAVAVAWSGFEVAPASARPSPTRTVLAFDNSGSMRTNDPQRLAEAAAMLYVELAKRGDKVGLVVFDSRAKAVVSLGEAGQRRRRLSRRLARLRLNGATTDIGRALDTSLAALGPPRKGVQDVVVLLTDGKVDLGKKRQAQLRKELQRLRTDVIRRFRRRGVAIYAIAFTPAADQALLSELAAKTNGAFRYIGSATELHQAFSELFTLASSASSLPVRGGTVVVDSSVGQTSLVLTKKQPGDANKVIAPDEEVLDAKSTRKGVKWKSSASYDLVELNKPQPGAWQLKDKNGQAPQAMAIIQDSDLELDVSFGPIDPTVDDEVEFRVQLLEKGRRVSNFSRLKNMTVEAVIESPDHTRHAVPFKEDTEPGQYVGKVKNTQVGQHGIRVAAVSPALQRQWRGSYAVRPPCFEHKVRFDKGPPLALVRRGKECPKYTDVKLEVSRHLEGTEPEWMVLQKRKGGIFGREIAPLQPGEKGVIRLRMSATSEDGYPILVEPEPVPLPEPAPGAWVEIIGKRLAYINIPVALLAGLGYFIFRARQKQEEVYDA